MKKRGRPQKHFTEEEKREAKRLYERRWYAKNKKRISAKKAKVMKEWRKNEKDGFHYVYCLPNANYYVGMTNCLKFRMMDHTKNRKNSTEHIILHKCDNRKEALEYEAIYHKLGFPGGKDK